MDKRQGGYWRKGMMNTINSIRNPPRFRLQSAYLWALIGILVLSTLPALILPQKATAQYQPGDEILELRGVKHKTHWLGGITYQTTFFTSSIHYQDAAGWQDIEEGIVPSDRQNWDWEVVKGRWTLLIKDDTSVAMGRDGHWAGFRLDGIAYLDNFTKEYVILQTRQAVTPTVSHNKIRWDGIFNGVNLEYVYTTDKFQENVEVTQAARNWLANHPPSDYGLSNQTSYLVFYAKCDWKNAYSARDGEGNLINWGSANEFKEGVVNFIHPVKQYVVSTLTPGWARAPPDGERLRVHKRFFKENGEHWLLFGSSVTKLNQQPQGTIVFDPDTFYPDWDPETATVDGRVQHNYNLGAGQTWATIIAAAGTLAQDDQTNNSLVMIKADNQGNDWKTLIRGFYSFNTEPIDNSNIIISAVLSVHGSEKYDNLSITPDINVYSAAPASNTTLAAGDFDTPDRTTAFSTAITYADYDTSGYNDFTLNSDGRDAIDKNGISKFSLCNANYDAAESTPGNWESETYSRFHGYFAEETGTSKDPKLVVTYLVVPTLDTLAADNITSTSADLHGNITATGGQNADFRGFAWDTTTRNDPGDTAPASSNYSDNWTEGGDFGTGTFAHNVSGLTRATNYYYRCFAHNDVGWAYGDEVSFTTLGEAPTVTNDGGATSVQSTSARMNGNVTDDGGLTTTAYVYWGDNDGSDNASAWDNPENLGTKTGTFYYDASNLTVNTTYFYRCYATNAQGNDWANSSVNFTTLLTVLGAPTDLTITDMGGYSVNVTWAKGTSANLTVIRMSRGVEDYPALPTEGEGVYSDNGTEIALHGIALDTTNYNFSAWSYLSGDYSDNYTTANIGGEYMEEIGIQLGVANDILTSAVAQVFAALLVMGVAGLAFWHRNRLLYVLAGLAFLLYGFSYWSSSSYMSIILVLLGISIFIKAWLEKDKAVK